jgi:hypothetical protein
MTKRRINFGIMLQGPMRPDFRLLVKNSWSRIGDIVSFVRFVGVVRKNTSPKPTSG